MYSTKLTDRCLQRAADDEPIFVLRGQDPTTPDAIREWANLAEDLGGTQEKVSMARQEADEIEEWQRQNPGRVKMYPGGPDLPAPSHNHGSFGGGPDKD